MSVKMIHTCIKVSNLEKSLKFYKNALEMVEVSREDFPEQRFTFVFLSDNSRSYELQLTYKYDQNEQYNLGDGFDHLAVEVDDLEKEREKHITLGYEVTDILALPGKKPNCYFLTDPDGYKIEVKRANL